MPENKFDIGDSLREKALSDQLTKIECGGCGNQAWAGDPHGIADLVEHAVFDHVTRQSLYGIRYVEMIDAYSLALRFGAAPQTEAEQQWRDTVTERISSP